MKRRLLQVLSVVVAGLAMYLWQPWRADDHHPVDRELIAKLQAENQQLKAQVEELRARGSGPAADAPEVAGEVREKLRRLSPPGSKALPRVNDQTATVESLRESLVAAQLTIDELHSRVADLQTQVDKARLEEKRLAAAEASWKEQAASANQQAEAATAELARRNDQLVRAEAANKKLRDDTTGGSAKAAQVVQLTKELQELDRRREGYMTTILARYRDITEQYRALARLIDSRRGPEGAPGVGFAYPGPELSRIQTTIGMAEEDLRQLTGLNAQVLQVQKKLQSQ